MRRKRRVVRLRHTGNDLQLGNAPRVVDIGLKNRSRPLLEDFPESPLGKDALAGGEGDVGLARLIASGHRSSCGSDGLGRHGGLWALRNDIRHDISVHIGQTEVAAGVAVGQLLVIQPQQVQDGGVEVVEVDLVFHRVVAVVVGGPVP